MKKSIIIIALLIIAAVIFELHPAVKEAQSYVSLENYNNTDTNCQTLLQDRPFFGRLNYWFYIWIVIVPAIIFTVTPHTKSWARATRLLAAALICYLLMNFAVQLQWDIRNAPFSADPINPDPLNGWRMDCTNFAGDGFSMILARYFAWIPACVYTGIWLFIWKQYYFLINKSKKELSKNIFESLFLKGLVIYLAIALLYIILTIAYQIISHFIGHPLFHPGIIGLIDMFILRPLAIPIEIFYY